MISPARGATCDVNGKYGVYSRLPLKVNKSELCNEFKIVSFFLFFLKFDDPCIEVRLNSHKTIEMLSASYPGKILYIYIYSFFIYFFF